MKSTKTYLKMLDSANEAGIVTVVNSEGVKAAWKKISDDRDRDWWVAAENPDLQVSDIQTLDYLVQQSGGKLTKHE